jgi:AcrR family transcriptional regulator
MATAERPLRKDAERPLRKDAERNRQRILEAARELFTQRGLGVTLNDIAHHAGCGVGTVYRRFPDKQQLIDALFEERIAEMLELAEQALADPDPWNGLTGFMEGALAAQARDMGLKELLLSSDAGRARVTAVRKRLLPIGEQLVKRAQEAGALRADISDQDMPVIQIMLGTVIDAGRDLEPNLWRRYLALVLRGLRADPTPAEPLPVGPLTEAQLERAMQCWLPARR